MPNLGPRAAVAFAIHRPEIVKRLASALPDAAAIARRFTGSALSTLVETPQAVAINVLAAPSDWAFSLEPAAAVCGLIVIALASMVANIHGTETSA